MFYTNMMQCPDTVLKRKWVKHFHPILAVASGQEIKDELTPGGGVSFNLMRCIVRALVVTDNKMYKGWLDRWRGLFDPRFVDEVCKEDAEKDWDYIYIMMDSKLWVTKLNG
ncbi:uncharacterized protein LOC119299188 [Triticum dicoccoides]|uniref:uncharacterized protein LOC119299188 n=1 Tax=Triticum dicoccoides TaxID=85692 RepID=UPI00188E3BFE|nr:uncharacterized protein LOC119299188 [Triticum dicoccoides]